MNSLDETVLEMRRAVQETQSMMMDMQARFQTKYAFYIYEKKIRHLNVYMFICPFFADPTHMTVNKTTATTTAMTVWIESPSRCSN